MRSKLFKQIRIGQHFFCHDIEYVRVETFFNTCCTPEYNMVGVDDDSQKGLMQNHATVEVKDDEEPDS